MRNRMLAATLILLGGSASALAGPQERPPGFPTVSAGPALPQAQLAPTPGYQTPFFGYGGYRKGADGRFHGYGYYGPRRSAALRKGGAPTPGPVGLGAGPEGVLAANGEVLASSILANQYGPTYGVLNVGYGPRPY